MFHHNQSTDKILLNFLWGVFGVLGDDMFSSSFENLLKGLLRLLAKLHRDLFWFGSFVMILKLLPVLNLF